MARWEPWPPVRPLTGVEANFTLLGCGFGTECFMNDLFGTRQAFDLGNGKQGTFYSLPALEKAGLGRISRLPVSIRIVLESVLRNCDGKRVTEANVKALAQWQPEAKRTEEI